MFRSLTVRLALLFPSLMLLCPTGFGFQEILPEGFVLETVGSGWSWPVGLCYVDPQRLLVAEKEGRVWYLEGGTDKNLVLDIRAEALNNGDRGLLAVAVDPQFDVNGWMYALLVVDPNGDGSDDEQWAFSRLVRYTLSYMPNGTLVADPASRVVLLGESWSTGLASCHWSHAVGSLRFMSDGSLVLATGDGAHYDKLDSGGLDPGCFGPGKLPPSEDIGAYRSAVLTSLSGKVLRVDPATALGLPDNPFFTGDPADPASRVWAQGLRNPYRFTLLPGTGPREAMVIADVGWVTWEELNLCFGGENFGWPCLEGIEATGYLQQDPLQLCPTVLGTSVPPLVGYHHFVQGGLGFLGSCASGVAQYTGSSYPRHWQGAVFFCDYTRGWIRAAHLSGDLTKVESIELFGDALGTPIDLVSEPGSGDLVYIDLWANTIRRVRYAGANLPPVAKIKTSEPWGPLPLAVTLDGSGSYDPEGQRLDYSWELGDGGTASGAVVQHVYTTPVNATARLTVTDPQGKKGKASVLISPGNSPPVITSVISPQPGQVYSPGDVVQLEATAVDAEDDLAGIPLVASWDASLVHAHHVHPAAATVTGLSGSFLADSHGPGTHYRITLRVEDSRALFDRETLDIYDLTSQPEPHVVSISDERPRQGQAVRGVAHVEHPITQAGYPRPDLEWDWGDGRVDLLPGVAHQEDHLVEHAYAKEGDYTLTLTVKLGTFVDSVSVPIHVRPPRPAVAVFQPLVTNRWVPFSAQQAIAQTLLKELAAQGVEADDFTYDQQDQLAAWMEDYLDDGIRDVLVVLDTIPAALYAGEDDDSLAESWLEQGNAIVWTGYEAFHEYVDADGWVSYAGAGIHGADEVLDSPTTLGLCRGAGQQHLLPLAASVVPSLYPYYAQRAVRVAELGPTWRVKQLYASDLDGESDALLLSHDSGGLFAQVWSTNLIGLPRAETILELLESLQPLPWATHVKR